MKFVDRIAHFILEKNIDAKHLTVVLPSERAIKYIAAALFRANEGPLIAPQFISIDKWIRQNTKSKIVDKTRLLIKLFAIQEKHPLNSEQLSFEEFMVWGQTLLSDFDEIDRYLLDPKWVFRNLSSIKELESWNVEPSKLSETQKRFMEFWDRLPEYYELLNKHLQAENSCYLGAAYRHLADHIEILFEKDKDHHYIFAGFNALSAAEMAIMKQLHRYGKADILLNTDEFYLKEEMHEAGMFQRQLIRELELKAPHFVENKLLTDHKQITVTACAQQTGQIKVAATILQEIPVTELDDTVVLLADENLIVPFLKNIPAKVGKANISLGLPFKNTPIKTWLELLFSIQENHLRFQTKALYHLDIRKFWNHPFLELIISDAERQKIVALEQLAARKNKIFRNQDSISVSSSVDQLLASISAPWENDWSRAMQQIKEGLQFVLSRTDPSDEFNQSLIETFLHTIQEFNNIVQEQLPAMTIRSFKNLFQQHWINKSIAYQGNPIKGLQIMGLLETRLLDFKNLIIVGLNEGNLPPLNPINTLIPMDLRSFLQLPTPREKQGLFAQHFYRLFHEAENCWATFSSSKENIGSSEESRYLMQLQFELSKQNKNIKFERNVYVLDEEKSEFNNSTAIEKTKTIVERIDHKLAEKTSASLLKKYLTCPLDFYYRYVAGLGESQEVEEQMESNTMGSLIHSTLEQLYEPFCRHDKNGIVKNPAPPAITSYDIEQFLKHYDPLIREGFAKEFDNDPKAFSTGKNLLILEVILNMTKRFLQQEKKWLEEQAEPVFIEYLEHEISHPMTIFINQEVKTIKLHGIIDRIDSVGGKYRIIDYKTGDVSKDDLKLNLEGKDTLIEALRKSKHGLQLAIYTYLFEQEFGQLPDQVGIISFIKITNGLFTFGNEKIKLDQYAEQLPTMIQEILAELYDEAFPFEHDSDAKYCLYCEEKKPEKNF